jgi:pyruvate formate lyase activating enzyme
MDWVTFNDILNHLYRVRGYITGLCIGGGEPTIHNGLLEFAFKTKSVGYKIKLDTNGTRPRRIRKLIEEKVLDYVALDIKAPLDRYEEVVQNKVNIEDVEESIRLLRRGSVDYEFGTTVVPGLVESRDIEELARSLIGSKRFVIRQFRPGGCLDPGYDSIRPFSIEELEKMRDRISPYFAEVRIDR